MSGPNYEGAELVVVEILEFELALSDFGTWRPRRVTLTLDLIWGEAQLRPQDKDGLFKAVLRSMRLFLGYCYTYGGA